MDGQIVVVVAVVVTCDALLAPLPVPPQLLRVPGRVLRLPVVQLLLVLLPPRRLPRALSLAPPLSGLLLLLPEPKNLSYQSEAFLFLFLFLHRNISTIQYSYLASASFLSRVSFVLK